MKIKKEEVIDEIEYLCIENWDKEYRAFFKSDDGGEHLVVSFEGGVPENVRDIIDSPFMGWRTILVNVPEGYLEVFYPLQVN